MEIILTDDVVGVGDIGEQVHVKPGFARNFLIPRGLAIETQSKNAAAIAHKMKQIEAKKKQLKLAAQAKGEELRNVIVELGLRVGSSGKVFGSISSRDIAEKLKEAGFDIDRRRVQLHEPIKKTGTHFVKVKLHADIECQIKVNIAQLAATKEDEEKAAQELKATLESKVAKAAKEVTSEDTTAE